MSKTMRIVIQVCRYILAVVFVFSGFVKGIDPLGSAYKFGDYFKAFHVDFLDSLSLIFSFILCASELLIGLLLLIGVRLRLAIWGVFLYMVVFTPLTFVLAVFNPVSDCGCFGDAVKLTNWETFYKNLFFLTAALILFIGRSSLNSGLKKWHERISFVVMLVIAFTPSWFGYVHLPLINFRPYKIGVNIPEAMKIPEGAPADEYKTTFYYEKNGEVKEFNETNYPWQDSTWKYVDSKSVIVKKGYTPLIENFHIYTIEGNDITDSIINFSGYYFLVISKDITKISTKTASKLNQLHFNARENGHNFAMITSSSQNQIDDFIRNTGALYPFLSADEVLLKTVIRSNPGLVLIKDGTIIGKWHYNDLPPAEYFNGNLIAKQVLEGEKNSVNRTVYLLISFLLILLLIKLHFKKLKN